MNSVSFILLSLLFLSVASEEHRTVYKDLVDKTVEIFRTCFFSHKRDTLLLAGEYEEFLDITEPPIALIKHSERTVFDLFTLTKHSFLMYAQYSFARLVRKVEFFVVISISKPSLRLNLQKIKDSTWANADGFYIIIDRHTESRGCRNAKSFLKGAWEYDMLSSIFFCIDPVEGPMLYTFNPYSLESPALWEEVHRFPGRRGHPWILLKRKFLPGKEICKDLNFDKTAALDGYEIRGNAINMPPLLQINLGKSGSNKFTGDNGEIIKILAAKLNASLYVMIYNGTSYDLGGIGSTGAMTGMLTDVSSGVVDMGMNTRPLHIMWKLRYTYPHANGGICVITQPAGYLSEFEKVIGFISLEASIGVYAVLVCMVIVLMKHQGYISACLNIFRLITTVAMINLPSKNSSRIIICMGILLIIIINGVFQGHWASLLTVSVPYPNINTLEELKKSGFRIYGPKILRNLLIDLELSEHYHDVAYAECKEHVYNSKTAACMGECLHLYERIRNENLHHSRKIRQLVQVYVTREDWPLFSRVNSVIQRMVQAGIVTMWRRQNLRHIYRERRQRRIKKKSGYKILRLRQLIFNFYILAIGYIAATIAFLIEIAIWKYRKHRQNRNLLKSFGITHIFN